MAPIGKVALFNKCPSKYVYQNIGYWLGIKVFLYAQIDDIYRLFQRCHRYLEMKTAYDDVIKVHVRITFTVSVK